MRKARSYRGENHEPGKDVTESLTPRPELDDGQDPKATRAARHALRQTAWRGYRAPNQLAKKQ